tara:strand:+ start:2751 stop:3005 length:255 start_codon:yes stop_codon:yes gene_type:complete
MMSKFDLVCVTWHDAHADSRWIEVTEIDNEPYLVTSVGYLVTKAKKGHVSLAQSFGADGFVDSVLHIPNKMIVSTTIITPADSV